MSPTLATTLDALKDQFTELHTRKEDFFWAAKMGLTDDPAATQKSLSEAEVAMNRFLQDPARIAALREYEARGEGTPEQRRTLAGWIGLFAANTIESPAARALSEEIVHMEGELQQARGRLDLGFTDPVTGKWESAGSNKLALLIRNDPDPRRRKAAYEALRSIEPHVLAHGFLDVVKKRNALGRLLGHEDYYALRVHVVERMTKTRLFSILDDLTARTADIARRELGAFAKQHGDESLHPWNFLFLRAGALAAKVDPYFGFGPALRRWGESFAALGVTFRGATLTLDLVDRAGKYENGFMHGPEVAFFDHGAWRPARINFTANAVPGAVGSGLRATETLFHEGGHAAHFANILTDAPCFSQEFAPTSVAYAETQSMFMDSILEDADWRVRYLRDPSGQPIPQSLVEDVIREAQPMRAWDLRAMLTVPMAERALYEIPDAELSADRVLDTFRAIERDLQGLSSGQRPVLAVPHLLTGEASAYYHGYVLAEMAVHQTREFFLQRDGHLVDNPRVGPDLAAHYWKPGNGATFEETLTALTGKGLSADAIVANCALTADEAVARARASIEKLPSIPTRTGPVDLDVKLKVIHGRETVATNAEGFASACEQFESWIASL
ncbi:MAG: M3 family metallopeptidase [Polyangiales bacterium]